MFTLYWFQFKTLSARAEVFDVLRSKILRNEKKQACEQTSLLCGGIVILTAGAKGLKHSDPEIYLVYLIILFKTQISQ